VRPGGPGGGAGQGGGGVEEADPGRLAAATAEGGVRTVSTPRPAAGVWGRAGSVPQPPSAWGRCPNRKPDPALLKRRADWSVSPQPTRTPTSKSSVIR